MSPFQDGACVRAYDGIASPLCVGGVCGSGWLVCFSVGGRVEELSYCICGVDGDRCASWCEFLLLGGWHPLETVPAAYVILELCCWLVDDFYHGVFLFSFPSFLKLAVAVAVAYVIALIFLARVNGFFMFIGGTLGSGSIWFNFNIFFICSGVPLFMVRMYSSGMSMTYLLVPFMSISCLACAANISSV